MARENVQVVLRKPGGNGRNRQLTVPAHLAVRVSDDSVFEPELTDDGILFRVVRSPAADGPAWLIDGVSDD